MEAELIYEVSINGRTIRKEARIRMEKPGDIAYEGIASLLWEIVEPGGRKEPE